MADIIKCDICGCEIIDWNEYSHRIIGYTVPRNWYKFKIKSSNGKTEKKDMCESCMRNLKIFCSKEKVNGN